MSLNIWKKKNKLVFHKHDEVWSQLLHEFKNLMQSIEQARPDKKYKTQSSKGM